MVQNKFHYAIVGATAAEIVYANADRAKENMGLTTWKNSPNGRILKSDVTAAKNYLTEAEIRRLERLVSSFFDYIEDLIERENAFTMGSLRRERRQFPAFREYKILPDKGRISKRQADEKAVAEYDAFNKTQKIDSDFEKALAAQKPPDALQTQKRRRMNAALVAPVRAGPTPTLARRAACLERKFDRRSGASNVDFFDAASFSQKSKKISPFFDAILEGPIFRFSPIAASVSTARFAKASTFLVVGAIARFRSRRDALRRLGPCVASKIWVLDDLSIVAPLTRKRRPSAQTFFIYAPFLERCVNRLNARARIKSCENQMSRQKRSSFQPTRPNRRLLLGYARR